MMPGRTLVAAIIADDLTGALDTGTPFVEAGLSVAVAIDLADIAEALDAGPEVVVVNTASRGLPRDIAAARAGEAARLFASARPGVVMKKIDSRLKGHVAAESAAIAAVFGFRHLLVAPAIPDQDRLTLDGHVVGRGVETPLPVAPLFAGHDLGIEIADAGSDAELDVLARAFDPSRGLVVGARGIGAALARHLSKGERGGTAFVPVKRTLFAFGSRDPITMAQMDRLVAYGDVETILDAMLGVVPDDRFFRLPALVRCTGEMTPDSDRVARTFAEGIAGLIATVRPDMLMVGGGDTAHALLGALGARVLFPKGEIEAGVPWCEVSDQTGRHFRCAVKSGGFGTSDSLLKLIARNQAVVCKIRHPFSAGPQGE